MKIQVKPSEQQKTKKTCTICKTEKPISEFHKKVASKDGLQHKCKACCTKLAADYRQANKESIGKYQAIYYQINKESITSSRAKYYQDNKENISEYRQNNKEAYAKRNAKYRQEHPDRLNAKNAKRRAIKRNQTPPDADFEKIATFYTEAQRLTEETGIPHEVDHIIPLSRGGLHYQDNLQVLTKSENCRKWAKLPDELK